MTKANEGKLDPKLEPKEDTVVPTGDEAPGEVKKVDPMDARKAMYKKGRENRELTQRAEDEEMPDAAAMRAAVEEAADGEEIGNMDTEDRPDRFADGEHDEDPEYVEPVDHEAEEIEPEPEPEPKEKPKMAKSLDYEVKNGKVKAVVNGREYEVPEADIIASGGLEPYQRLRAANILFEQSATQARALAEEKKKLAQPPPGAEAKGEPPATGALNEEATLEDNRKAVLKAVLEGEESDLDEVIKSLRQPAQAPANTGKPSEATVQSPELQAESIVENYRETWKRQLQEANTFLVTEYSDVISDPDLRAIGDQKFKELRANPVNQGRLPKDMAREAGEFAREISQRGSRKMDNEGQERLNVRREKKRVLPKSSQAHQRPAASQEKPIPSARDHIKNLQRASGQGATRKYNR